MASTIRRVKIDFPYGSVVYQRAADEKCRGIVTGFLQSAPESPVVYIVSWGDGREGNHFAVELSDEYLPDYAEES